MKLTELFEKFDLNDADIDSIKLENNLILINLNCVFEDDNEKLLKLEFNNISFLDCVKHTQIGYENNIMQYSSQKCDFITLIKENENNCISGIGFDKNKIFFHYDILDVLPKVYYSFSFNCDNINVIE